MAVAPTGQTFATRLQGDGACWNCKMRAGTVMTGDEAVREMVEAGMVQVYREEPEPPLVIGVIYGQIEDGAGYGIIKLRQNCSGIPWGTPITAVVLRGHHPEYTVRTAVEALKGDNDE